MICFCWFLSMLIMKKIIDPNSIAVKSTFFVARIRKMKIG